MSIPDIVFTSEHVSRALCVPTRIGVSLAEIA